MSVQLSFTKRTIGSFFLCLLLAFSMVLPSISSHEVFAASSDYKIVGYYPSWAAYGRDYQVSDMDVSKVTHINYAFADICWDGKHGNPDPEGPNPQTWSCQNEQGQTIDVPNGSIVLGDPWIDAQKSFDGDTWDQPLKGNLNQLNKLKEANPHLKTIISVGGWTWSNRFSDVATSATTRENFANSAVDFLRKYQFDGVDLDWEYPVSGGLPGNSYRPEDKQNHVLLLQKIREKLDVAETEDGREYLLTIASGAGPTYAQNNELGQIADVVDWINIMTYDFNGGWQALSAHNAPLYFDPAAEAAGVPNAESFNIEAGVQGHLDEGVPANKIVLGTPFYGRGWSGCQSSDNGQYQNCGAANEGTWENGVFDFTDLQDNYINKNGYTRYWNDAAKVPYLFNPTNGNFISYDDVESFGYKTSFIKSKGLGGAMFWEFSGDRNNTLLNKLTSDLETPGETTPPTVPGNLNYTDVTSNSVSLSWEASTDNIGVTGYIVSYGSTTKHVTGTSTTINNLLSNTEYTFTVKAIDGSGNVSGESNPVTVATEESSDLIAPSEPTNLAVIGTSTSSVSLNWTASTDNVEVAGYSVDYGSNSVDVTDTSATITGLTADTTYTITVTARDAAGNVSTGISIQATTNTDSGNSCTEPEWNEGTAYTGGQRVSYNGKTYEAKWWTQGDRPDQSDEWGVWKYISDCGVSDQSPPSIPGNLSSIGKTSHSVSLTWDASTDNVGVTGYIVSYGTNTIEVTSTSTTISGLAANTEYTLTVKAKDAAGNQSGESNPVTVTTEASDDSEAPTVPAWEPNKDYALNDEVKYDGIVYICRQAHTSQVGWEPPNVPAIWLEK
jgi:chitinase